MKSKMFVKLIFSALVFTFMAWLVSCAVNPVTKKREFMLLTESDEIGLGQQTDAQIIQTYGVYQDTNLDAYVDAMGKRMGVVTHRPHLNYDYKVLDTPVINAFAVPGGFVYVTRGILAYFNNEAELAGVLAHELGHVNARHSAKQYSTATLAQLGIGLGAVFSETFRKYAGIANFGVSMLFLKFSRDNEREADALGVEYSSKIGYDAHEMAKFFETLERLNPGSAQSGLPAWFSTHPNPPDRVKAVLRDTEKWQQKLPGTNFAVNRNQYLKKLEGMTYGEDPRQGYVDGTMFYHPELKFQFPVPSQWQLNNTPQQVQMFNQNQDAVIIFALEQGASPSDAANAFVTNAQATVQKSEQLNVNRMPAHRLISDIQTEQGALRIMSYFIKYGNAIYVFHGYTAAANFNAHSSTFNNTMANFKQLTDRSKINVKPAVLRVRTVPSRMTAKKALLTFGVPQNDLESMAILNGVQLNDMLPAKTLLKVVKK